MPNYLLLLFSTSGSLNMALSIFTTCLFTRLCCGGLLVQECEEELTGLSQDKDCLKETCIGVTRTIAADEFTTAIRH
jgi:hypothetical protein